MSQAQPFCIHSEEIRFSAVLSRYRYETLFCLISASNLQPFAKIESYCTDGMQVLPWT